MSHQTVNLNEPENPGHAAVWQSSGMGQEEPKSASLGPKEMSLSELGEISHRTVMAHVLSRNKTGLDGWPDESMAKMKTPLVNCQAQTALAPLCSLGAPTPDLYGLMREV